MITTVAPPLHQFHPKRYEAPSLDAEVVTARLGMAAARSRAAAFLARCAAAYAAACAGRFYLCRGCG